MFIDAAIIEDEPDRKGFELMYDTYCQLLYQISYDIVKDNFLAEDAVNITFLRAAENFTNLPKPVCKKTKHFLIVVCRRVSIDLYRKSKRDRVMSLDTIQDNIVDKNFILFPEEEGTVGAAIVNLPETYREIILLRYYHGYSTKEIAKMLSFSEAKTAKYLTNAKKQLKKLLEKEGYAYEVNG